MVGYFNRKTTTVLLDEEGDWCHYGKSGLSQKTAPETNQNLLGTEDSVSSENAFYYSYCYFDETKALPLVYFDKTKKENNFTWNGHCVFNYPC